MFGSPLGRLSYNLSLSGPVAQLVEQWIENPRVGSSILPQATKFQWYILKTLFTVCTGHIVNNLGPNGLGPGSIRQLSMSK